MSGFLAILSDASSDELASNVSTSLGYVEANILHGTPASAIEVLKLNGSPTYLLIDIGSNSSAIVDELDSLAQYCDPKIKVIVIGDVNDLNLYRELLQRGVAEYFVKPVAAEKIKESFMRGAQTAKKTETSEQGKVISFMSSSSGDGSTTIATNVAYALAKEYDAPTVLVDMDYQFGLLTRNLDLSPSSGIKELYEHPEGSIDEALLEKTVVSYKDNLSIIGAPRVLGTMPAISNNTIANLIFTLRKKYKYVVLDVPHIWADWTPVLFRECDRNYLVAQLNIKSLTHTSRLMDALNINGVPTNLASVIINRSGSKLKEPSTSNDFSMACKKKIDHYISNDSKTISISEDQGNTAIEIGNSMLNRQFKEIAESVAKL